MAKVSGLSGELWIGGEEQPAEGGERFDVLAPDDGALIGSAAKIRERLHDWRACEQRGDLDMMMVASSQPEALKLMAGELL